eukprot:SAG31_NODE_903_length_11121_cov_10.117311_7_plen_119_part_00
MRDFNREKYGTNRESVALQGRPPKDGGRLVSLPDTVTALPREKPVPVKAPQTKWEKFAEKKGIVKKKRSRMVFDEESQEYKPRYGYKSVDKDGIESRGIIPHKPGLSASLSSARRPRR